MLCIVYNLWILHSIILLLYSVLSTHHQCIYNFGAETKSYTKFENFGKIYNVINWIDSYALCGYILHIISVIRHIYWEFKQIIISKYGLGKIVHESIKQLLLMKIIRSKLAELSRKCEITSSQFQDTLDQDEKWANVMLCFLTIDFKH